jgi:Spy/CpxP family protein refolding chaperone
MKTKFAGIFAALLLLVGTLAAGAFYVSAQNNGRDFQSRFGRGGDGNRDEIMRKMFERVADKLSLSPEQRELARQILADSKTRVEPLVEQTKANHDQIKQLGRDGAYDAERVEPLAAAQADLMRQIILEKEKTKAALFAVLTAEQRSEAAKLMDEFGARFRSGRALPMF